MSNTKPIKRSSTIFPYRGKWRAQYFDAEGRIRTKTLGSKEDAYKYIHLAEQLVSDGKLPKRPCEIPTFEEWIWQWYETRKNEVRPVTLLGFESTIRLHLLSVFGQKRINQINTSTIENLYSNLIQNKNLKPATIHKIHALLSHAFQSAIRYGYLDSNPTRNVKLPQIVRAKQRVLSINEIQSVLDKALENGPKSLLRWSLALRYGLRQGECLALTWQDFDLDRGELTINKSVRSHPKAGYVVTFPKSQNSIRNLPLDQETIQLVEVLRPANFQSGDLVFPNSFGDYQSAKTDYWAWHKILKEAGIANIKLHAARHSAATALLHTGADIRTIQLILGHSTPSFTMATYVHPEQQRLLSAIEATKNRVSNK